MSHDNRSPLNAAALDALALRYVGRYATTRAKLAAYLMRKARERGFEGEPPVAAIVERLARLGYVDDRAFAEMRAGSLSRRGYGGRRIAARLREAGIEDDVAQAVAPDEEAAFAAALAYARRRRIGAFAAAVGDADMRRRALGAMLRAGHGYDLARRFVMAAPGDVPERD